jgi:hypothetical protein
MRRAVLVVLAPGLAALCCVGIFLIGQSFCRDDGVIAEVSSPDGQYTAGTYASSCYMSSTIYVDARLSPVHQEQFRWLAPDHFSVMQYKGYAQRVSDISDGMTLTWISDRVLLVNYPAFLPPLPGCSHGAPRTWRDVEIIYRCAFDPPPSG